MKLVQSGSCLKFQVTSLEGRRILQETSWGKDSSVGPSQTRDKIRIAVWQQCHRISKQTHWEFSEGKTETGLYWERLTRSGCLFLPLYLRFSCRRINTIVNIGSIVQLHWNLNIKPYKPAIGFNGSRPTTVSCSPVHIKCRLLLAIAWTNLLTGDLS